MLLLRRRSRAPRALLLAAALLATLAVPAAGQSPDIVLTRQALDAGRVTLPQRWLHLPQDHPDGADPRLDVSGWSPVDISLPTGNASVPGDVGWFRLRFSADSTLRDTRLFLRLRENAGAAELWLDGVRLQTLGDVHVGTAASVQQAHEPVEVSLSSGEHVLAVRYSIASARAVADALGLERLGFSVTVERAGADAVPWANVQTRTAILMFLVGLLFAFGAVHLTLFLFHSRPATNLWFALCAFTILLYAGTIYLREASVSLLRYHAMDRLFSTVVLPLTVLAVGRFVYAVFYDRLPRHFAVFAAVVIAPLPLALLQPSLFPPAASASLAVAVALLVGLVIRAILRRREGAWVIGIGVLAVGGMSVIFDALPAFGVQVDPAFIRFRPFFGVLWLLLGMSIYLARSFARTSRGFERLSAELEDANRTLEERVTERTARLSASEHKFRSLVENASDAILLIDAMELHVLEGNPAAERLLGLSGAELRARRFPELCPPGEFERYLPLFRHHIETGASIQEDIFLQHAAGSRVPVAMSGSISEIDGQPVIQAIVHDLSDRKRAEAALEEAKDAAEVANRAKSQFMANMSHELRTPLNAVIGYSEMLMEDAEDAGQQDMTEDLMKINSAGRHLLGLINQVLDISKVEAGRMELHIETFDVGAMLNEVADTVKPVMEKNRNRFTLTGASAAVAMHADPVKVRQILLNLLSNAAKFTTDGTVSLEVQHEPDDGTFRFSVKDTGIGMTAAQMSRLFEPFTQADPSVTVKFGGTGLGLAISRHFATMMGGRIDVSSKLDVGSTFTAVLPVRVTSAMSVEQPA